MPKTVSAEIVFSANPGTFEIDFQGADEDSDGLYDVLSGGKVTSGLNANFATRVELTGLAENFIRCVAVSVQNAVQVTVKFFRHY